MPPYSPFLNPIEEYFAQLKKKFREIKFMDTMHIEDHIFNSIKDIHNNNNKIKNYVAHSYDVMCDQCLYKQTIE